MKRFITQLIKLNVLLSNGANYIHLFIHSLMLSLTLTLTTEGLGLYMVRTLKLDRCIIHHYMKGHQLFLLQETIVYLL